MHIADHGPPIGAEQPLQRIANNSGAQMADMHGLGYIRPAKIQHRGFALASFRRAEAYIRGDRTHPFGKNFVTDVEIDESGPCDLYFGENSVRLQPRRNFLGYRPWI